VGTAAMAQPAMGPGHHGPGPGMGMDIEHVLAGLQAKLNLNTSQQGMWDTAVAQTNAARDSGHANMQKLHDALAAELANTTPNLAGVAAVPTPTRSATAAAAAKREILIFIMMASLTFGVPVGY